MERMQVIYTAHEVAKYIINWCNRNNIGITNLKLQKLLYFVQRDYCSKRRVRLIKEGFYAWQLGLVVPEVYKEYEKYGEFAIPKQSNVVAFTKEEAEVIEQILSKYAYRQSWDLVWQTQAEDSWKYTYRLFGDNEIIPFETIYKAWFC